MINNARPPIALLAVLISMTAVSMTAVSMNAAALAAESQWQIGAPTLTAGPADSFDEIAVKDPTIVFFDGRWHLFYTARSKSEYTTGYVAAESLEKLNSAKRHELKMIRGKGRYGCAPQVLYYRPQKKWYLIFQNRDANYQPVFSTTATVDKPETWSDPKPLIRKDARAKWIDFWVMADRDKAYLFYTQGHRGVMVRSTALEKFPDGWGQAKEVLRDIHEAVHIYKVKDRREFHMIYELNHAGVRSFGIAMAADLAGPWTKKTDKYATGDQLEWTAGTTPWTEMVSHGEVLRSGYDERMEYDPNGCRWLIQGILKSQANVPYPSLPWKLGIITNIAPTDAE